LVACIKDILGNGLGLELVQMNVPGKTVKNSALNKAGKIIVFFRKKAAVFFRKESFAFRMLLKHLTALSKKARAAFWPRLIATIILYGAMIDLAFSTFLGFEFSMQYALAFGIVWYLVSTDFPVWVSSLRERKS
jgi:hypothetical protein